ncbi:unnamed protein product [Ectocarpus sp. CCAP 1310/34]|nr:unnamed protein product [Ectocarpus sp. CCAP 1310/34]
MAWRASLSRNVRELRFCCCNISQSGAPVREFFRTNYAELKTLNPGFPILLREGTGADPYLLATYDYGVEHRLSLSGLSQENIAKEVEKAVEKGSSLPLSPMQPSFRSASAGAVEA